MTDSKITTADLIAALAARGISLPADDVKKIQANRDAEFLADATKVCARKMFAPVVLDSNGAVVSTPTQEKKDSVWIKENAPKMAAVLIGLAARVQSSVTQEDARVNVVSGTTKQVTYLTVQTDQGEMKVSLTRKIEASK